MAPFCLFPWRISGESDTRSGGATRPRVHLGGDYSVVLYSGNDFKCFVFKVIPKVPDEVFQKAVEMLNNDPTLIFDEITDKLDGIFYVCKAYLGYLNIECEYNEAQLTIFQQDDSNAILEWSEESDDTDYNNDQPSTGEQGPDSSNLLSRGRTTYRRLSCSNPQPSLPVESLLDVFSQMSSTANGINLTINDNRTTNTAQGDINSGEVHIDNRVENDDNEASERVERSLNDLTGKQVLLTVAVNDLSENVTDTILQEQQGDHGPTIPGIEAFLNATVCAGDSPTSFAKLIRQKGSDFEHVCHEIKNGNIKLPSELKKCIRDLWNPDTKMCMQFGNKFVYQANCIVWCSANGFLGGLFVEDSDALKAPAGPCSAAMLLPLKFQVSRGRVFFV